MKKIILMFVLVLSTGIIFAADPPQLIGEIFGNGETTLEFKSSNKVDYLHGEGTDPDDYISRKGTYSIKNYGLKTKTSTSHGSIYKWQVTINLEMSYGSKTLTGWMDVYEDGEIVKDEMNINGNIWKKY